MNNSFDYKIVLKAQDLLSQQLTRINQLFKKMSNHVDMNLVKVRKLTQNVGFSNLSNGINKSSLDFNNLSKNIHNKTDSIKNKLSSSFSGIGERLKNSIMPLTLGLTALGGSLILPISKARAYEDTLLEVRRAIDLTDEQAQSLRNSLMNMEGGSFQELGAIASDVAKAGVANIDDILEITDVLNKASKALGMDVTSAQTAISKIISLNDLEVTGKTVKHVADMLANLENKMTNVSTTELADVWKRTSKAATGLNLSLEEQGAITSALLSRGISPELAASEFTMFYNKLGDAQKKLGIDFRKKIQTEGIEGFKESIQIFAGLGAQGMQDVLGAQGKKIVETLQTESGMKELDKGLQAARTASGAVNKEWKEYQKTFTSVWNDLKKEFDNFLASLGAPLMKTMTPVLRVFSSFLKTARNFSTEFPNVSRGINIVKNSVSSLLSVFTPISIGFSKLSSGLSKVSGEFPMLSQGLGYLTTTATVLGTSVAGVAGSLFVFKKARDTLTNTIGIVRESVTGFVKMFRMLSIQYIKSAGAFLFNPFTLLAIGVTAIVAGILYFIYNWNKLKGALLDGYNNYIAPVADGFRKGFASAINFIRKKLYDFTIFFKEKVAWLASGTIGKKIFGFSDEDLEQYKSSIQELKDDREKMSKELDDQVTKISSKISPEAFEKSAINKGMTNMSEFLKGAVGKIKGFFTEQEQVAKDIATNNTKGQGKLAQNLAEAKDKVNTDLVKKTKEIQENKLNIEVSLKEPLQAAIKTDIRRSNLKQKIRTIAY